MYSLTAFPNFPPLRFSKTPPFGSIGPFIAHARGNGEHQLRATSNNHGGAVLGIGRVASCVFGTVCGWFSGLVKFMVKI